MSNVLKYSPGGTGSGTFKKGGFIIGNGTSDYGITYYNGITPSGPSGYTIYSNKASQGPSIVCPSNDTELIYWTSSLSGQNFNSDVECLSWFGSQEDKVCFNRDYPPTVVDGLSVDLEAGLTPSYPRGGTSWYDLSYNGSVGTLENFGGSAFNSGGWITFDGTDDYVNLSSYISTIRSLQTGTIEQWLKLDSTLTSCTSFFIGVDINNRFEFVFGNRGSVINESTGIIVFQGGVQVLVFFVISSSSSFYFDNRWHQFVYKSDSSGNSFYIDGVKQTVAYSNGNSSTQQFFSMPTTPTIANIGRRVLSGVASQVMKGSNSITRIYNRAITDQEVAQNYYQGPIVTGSLAFAVDASNLISYETGSTTTYSLVGSTTGSLQNGVGFSTRNGGIWTFDASDDRIFYGSKPIDFNPSTQPFSMGGWINLSSSAGTGTDAVLLDINGSSAGGLYIAINKSPSYLKVVVRPNAGTQSTPVRGNDNTVSFGQWIHAMATFDGGTIKLYQNGELISTATGFSNYPTALANWYSGFQDDNDNYMDGYIGSALLYLKVLSPSEIVQNYNAQKYRFES